MKRIGVLFGQERTFPEAFCHAVNARDTGATAEPVEIEALRHDSERPYDVIVDRISHEVPYYQMFLKQCALLGTRVINNPFWRIADDKYFGTVLAARLGVAVPKTLLLPQREYVADIKPESLTSLRLVNAHVRPEEIALATTQLAALTATLANARVRLDAVRLVWKGDPKAIRG